MRMSLLESLRRIIRQDLSRVDGPIGNLHGAVAGTSEILVATPPQSWLVLQVPGTSVPALEEFFQVFTNVSGQTARLEGATEGSLTVTLPAGTVGLCRAVTTVTQAQTVLLKVRAERATVYLDGVRLRSVEGEGLVSVALTPGQRQLTVIAVGSRVSLSLPSNLELSGTLELPPIPQWRDVTTGYLEAQNGTIANTLEWAGNSQVGGYRVLRRSVTPLGDPTIAGDGEIVAIGDLAADSTFLVSVSGDFSTTMPGTMLLTAGGSLGTVMRASLDEAVAVTLFTCRLPQGASAPSTDDVGQVVYTGTFVEIARVTQVSNAAVVQYQDTTVQIGQAYEYALQSHGLLDTATWSPLSEVVYQVAGDATAPGPITLTAGYPTVQNRQVTVRFTTPTDADYQGVHVYYKRVVQNGAAPFTLASRSGNVLTVTSGTLPALTGYSVSFGTDIVPYAVTASTATTITLATAPVMTTAAGTALVIYRLERLRTDYGVPGRSDELTFTATDYGTHAFLTFDRSGNEQQLEAGVAWDYTTADDVYTSGPLLALRQLSAAEQAEFSGYADRARFAIVEVYGVSQAGSTAGITLYYRRREDVAEVTLPMSAVQSGAFPRVVTVGSSPVVDTPSGTRSRYIAMARDNNRIQVRAVDAEGYGSDTITFVVDLDDRPTVTSLETSINNLDDTVRWVGVVDDDTQSVEWYLDFGLSTQQGPISYDTSTVKVIPPANTPPIALPLGRQRELLVIPYAVSKTLLDGYTAQQKAAVAGETVVRSLVRTPRSFVNLDYKDAQGLRSATEVTATFTQTPAGVPQTLRVGETSRLGTLNPTTRVLTDIGTTATTWTAGQWVSGATAAFYVRFTPTVVRAATTAAVTLSGTQTIDGVTLVAGDRVLVKDQATASQNGIYVVAAGAWARAEDFDSSAEVFTGTAVNVTEGTLSRLTGWTLTTSGTITVGTTGLTFVRGPWRPAVVRRILANTATTATVDGTLSYATTGTGRYEILDGAVMVRQVVAGQTPPAFLPTVGTETSGRGATFTYEFYATKNGCQAENVRSMQVDEDTTPSLVNFRYAYNETTKDLTVLFDSPDDDAKYWEVYERKGAWPTASGTPTEASQLLSSYFRFSATTDRTSYVRNMTGLDTGSWYAVAVPKNSLGQVGTIALASINLGSPPAPTPQISDVSLSPVFNTATLNITIGTLNVANGSTVTVSMVRTDNQSTLQTASPTVTSDVATYALNVGETIVPPGTSGAVSRTWSVTVSVAGGNSITKQISFLVAGAAPATVIISNAIAGVNAPGKCYYDDCANPSSYGHSRFVTWNLTINGVAATAATAAPYYVSIEVATDSGGVQFSPIASGVPAWPREYIDSDFCIYSPFTGGTLRYWTYRLTVTDGFGTPISGGTVTTTSIQCSDNILVCSGKGSITPL